MTTRERFDSWPGGEIPAPSQHQRDQFEAMYGKPMSEADERFFGLRETAGYTGWIDQDGWPVSPAEHEQMVSTWNNEREGGR